MQVFEPNANIVNDRLDVQKREVYRGLEQLLQVGLPSSFRNDCKCYLSILHHHVDRFEVSWIIRFQNFYDLNEIRVIEFSEDANLPQDPLAVNFIIEDAVQPNRLPPRSRHYFFIATFLPVGL